VQYINTTKHNIIVALMSVV